MKTFNHVNDVWDALEGCETMKQVEEVLDNVPRKLGEWWCDVINSDELEVTNQWWDEDQQDMMMESTRLHIQVGEDD